MLTPAIRRKVGDLKAEHPPLNYEEIANIGERLFGRTVKSVLEESAIPRKLVRRFPTYHGAEDVRESREAVVTLHHEGWSDKSIARYLRVDRSTVYRALGIEKVERRLADHFFAKTETREETPRGTAPTREGKTDGAAPRRFSVP